METELKNGYTLYVKKEKSQAKLEGIYEEKTRWTRTTIRCPKEELSFFKILPSIEESILREGNTLVLQTKENNHFEKVFCAYLADESGQIQVSEADKYLFNVLVNMEEQITLSEKSEKKMKQ